MQLDPQKILTDLDRGLPKSHLTRYVHHRTDGDIKLIAIDIPNLTIFFQLRKKGEHWSSRPITKITSDTIKRLFNKIKPYEAFSVDTVLNASGSHRSVFEAILAMHPAFHVCYPGQILIGCTDNVKHLYFDPSNPHEMGKINFIQSIRGVMTKAPPISGIAIPSHPAKEFPKLTIHQQMQVKLFEIGAAMQWMTWIAETDRNVRLNGKPLSQRPSAVKLLEQVTILSAFPNAQKAAKHLDVAFFRYDGFIPGIVEIEHTTGVNSGLNRMETFRQSMAGVFANAGSNGTCFIICADDDQRDSVMKKTAAAKQYRSLAPRFMPYSKVALLWTLCHSGHASALKENVLEVFSEPCVI